MTITTTITRETTMNNVTTRQLLDEALAAYFHECRVWRSTGHMPWNRDQAKRVGVLSTKCERLRRQLDAENNDRAEMGSSHPSHSGSLTASA